MLPILVLLAFITAQGVLHNSYNKWILLGLGACAVGDILLVWQNKDISIFLLGMLFFSLGNISYIIAFGFWPFGLKEFLLGTSVTSIILSCLSPYLKAPMSYYVICYGYLVGFLWWRALARFNLQGDIPWRKIYAAIGATLFAISDSFLGFNKFCCPIPYDDQIIMITYYGAQMFIAFSIINSGILLSDKETNHSNGVHSHPVVMNGVIK